MSTEVYLGTLQASNSLKSLKTVVNSVTASWKAQANALRASGDSLKAAQVKYDGLSKSIKSNQDVINNLRDKQKGLDQTTQDGARQYAKYQAEIDRTQNRIASLTRQQAKASESLSGYKSGIIGLEKSIKSTNDLTKSYIDRLRAEGKEYKALEAEASGYRTSLQKTSSLYSKQSTELSQHQQRVDGLNDKYEKSRQELTRLTQAGKENTDEYARARQAVQSYKNELDSANGDLNKQKIRVNETATSMAKLKTSITKVEESERKLKPTGLTRLIGGLQKVDDKAEKTQHIFGSVFGGQIMANGVMAAWNTLTNHINDATRAGLEYDKTQQKMLATWTTLTGSAKKGQAMVDTTNRLSVALGQDVDVTDELNQQFYHVLDKQKPTERLTRSVLTMSDAVGLSAENTKNLGLNFTHMMSSSKMQVGDFNHITDALPMYGHALLEYEQKVQKILN
ncbi:tape measure protein [Lentilactobacillus kosonis]|uniref:Phage tail length tape-measure protein n=1 Tax=Lentilactobacillus kosonis TaxID=2810561 RepID=A0A401FPS2_9LACO|nr:tape measure protein [Lentilactobacillus kosonis]GAY74354.1 phage tail length tape-measure protein [Lentilactobacillus kosonis]